MRAKINELTQYSLQLARALDLDGLKAAGITQDLYKHCYTATYPPLKATDPYLPGKLYSDLSIKKADVYLHLPFCTGRCTFCHFNVLTTPNTDLMEQYSIALKTEISMLGRHVKGMQSNSLYIGGGTPSYFSIKQISEYLEALRGIISFSEAATLTMEIHPELYSRGAKKYLLELKALGINRLSIGVEDFSSQVLAASNRRHTSEEAQQIVQWAKEIGFSINIDLLAPLAYQTIESWGETLAIAFGLDIDSVTQYTTSIRDSMILSADIKSGIPFPDEITRYSFYIMTQVFAKEAGRSEKKSRWFTRCTENDSFFQWRDAAMPRENVLGIGCGAYGFIGDSQYFNMPLMQDYLALIAKGELPSWQGLKLTKNEAMHRELVFSARDGQILFEKFSKLYATDLRANFAKEFETLVRLNLGSIDDSGFFLIDKGRIFSDEIASLFVSELVKEKVRQHQIAGAPKAHLFHHLNHFYELPSVNAR